MDNSIKAIIFDCDGTLIDNIPSFQYAWQKILVSRNHYYSLDDHFMCVGHASPDIVKAFAARLNISSTDDLLLECKKHYHEHLKTCLKPIQHTVDFALNLVKEKERLGIKLAVASAGKKKEIMESLAFVGLDKAFDVIVSGQDDLQGYHDPEGVNKPKPYIYLHAAKMLGADPSSCIAIEDTHAGSTAAVKAGCFTIAVPNSSTVFEDFSHTDLILKSFEDMTYNKLLALVQEKQKSKEKPTVIFLNGTSSSGKTTLVKHLQEQMDKPYIHIGIDHFLFMLPSRYRMDGAESHLGYYFKAEEGRISITKGVYGNKMTSVKLATIRNLLSQGFNLIIDEVLFAYDDYLAYLKVLKDSKLYFIAVKPPQNIAVEREKARGDRMIGLARSLYEEVYRNKNHDLEIDTSHLSPADAAKTIVQYIQGQ